MLSITQTATPPQRNANQSPKEATLPRNTLPSL